MKILQVTSYFLHHVEGVERCVYNIISRYLISQGHTVDIITSNIPASGNEEGIDGIHILKYNCKFEPLGNPIILGFSDIKSKLSSYDLIHIHGVYTYIAFRIILSINPELHQKIILTHHGRVVYSRRIINLISKLYERLIVPFILKRVDRLVVLSESDKKHMYSLGMNNESISIIPNGIDTSLFKRQYDGIINKFKTEYNLADNKTVLFLVAISERNGIFDLINSFKYIDRNDGHLLVVGTGPDLDKTKKLSNSLNLDDKITFQVKIIIRLDPCCLFC